MTDTIAILKKHSSVRDFLAKPVADELLREILLAGQQAATSNHIQAYSILRMRDQEKRQKLAALCGQQKHVAVSPVFLVFCADLKRLQQACELHSETIFPGAAEAFILATVDTALAAQNVMAAAESAGLGGVYIGGIRNHPREVCELLAIPKYVYPVFGMCLGYPAKVNDVKPRLPLEAILKEDAYTPDDPALMATYDQQVAEYYAKRTAGERTTSWTDGVAAMMKTKQRPHMKAFLAEQGFDFD
ncbi:MAG: oxygen-insensitive NADPH nitroreductase [Sporomusaceae bacterium]|nr:oxygen-insensitive NADPH nitroreductase [Sporomusaceae bacterium]